MITDTGELEILPELNNNKTITSLFDILFQNDDLIAINKPSGWLVHRTGISEDKVFILQTLRDQIGQYLFPIHRLDRRTSGVLFFGKKSEAARDMQALFQANKVQKKYYAVVRGWTEESGTIKNPTRDPDKIKAPQDAITHYKTLATCEMPWAIGQRYQTARYSLVNVQLETGRRHQIRQHFSHLRHPIIGDKFYGDLHHNGFFWEKMGERRQLLHAYSFAFPWGEEMIQVNAPLDGSFLAILKELEMPV